MSVCIKDLIQNMNLVIGCTVGCPYCYARNNVRRYHMIDDFSNPEFFPQKMRLMQKQRPQNFLLTGMSDLSGWKEEWREEVFAKIKENPQHQPDPVLHHGRRYGRVPPGGRNHGRDGGGVFPGGTDYGLLRDCPDHDGRL